MTGAPLLEVEDLRVSFAMGDGWVRAVDGVSFAVGRGEVVAIVGESGSGKSVTALSVVGLVGGEGAGGVAGELAGSVRLEGEELVGAPERRLREIRGSRIAMVFQDPMSSLNPVMRVGAQIVEQIRAHQRVSGEAAWAKAREALARAGVPRPEERSRAYPHELSGGLRQRVMIAMALSCSPSLLVADEPTTALDVTVQAQIVAELARLRESGTSVILITHDLAVVAGIADRIAVMEDGRLVEQGTAREVFGNPRHKATRRLLDSIVTIDGPRRVTSDGPRRVTSDGTDRSSVHASGTEPLLRVEGLTMAFPVRRGIGGGRKAVHALDGVSLEVMAGETVGVVGESGCGKSTLLRCVARLLEPTAGEVIFEGVKLREASKRRLRELRRRIQVVFQDPEASLNPRRRVAAAIARPLGLRGVSRRRRPLETAAVLDEVGLGEGYGERFPHELSGGQRQRVGIARALAMKPSLLLLDEPVSALDAPARARVLDVIDRLRERAEEAGEPLGCLFVAHDLALVRQVSDRIAVMYLGKIVESGPAAEVCESPVHPYTKALLEAVPTPDPSAPPPRPALSGEPPSPMAPPSGCRFHPRCPYATDICEKVEPPMKLRGSGRAAACHHPLPAAGAGREAGSEDPLPRAGAGCHDPLPPAGAGQEAGCHDPLPPAGAGREAIGAPAAYDRLHGTGRGPA